MATMAEKPPLVVAVERALNGPATWVRYTLGPATRPSPSWQPAMPEAVQPVQPVAVAPLPSSDEDLSETPPLVAAVEEALGSPVETLRYLPSITRPAAASAVAREMSTTDDALVAAVQVAVSDAVLWLRYSPATDSAPRNSRRVA